MKSIAIADRMPYNFERDRSRRVWWGAPDRHDPETGERYGASWDLREEPYDGCTEWMPAIDLPAANWADEHDTYREAA
jgi:hypothetical protein